MSTVDMRPFTLDYLILLKKLKFRIDVLLLPPDQDASWRRSAVPSHARWASARIYILDTIDIPRSRHDAMKLVYQFGEAKGPQFELQCEKDWVDLCAELRENLESI